MGRVARLFSADDVLALTDNPPTWCEDGRFWLDTEVARGHLTVMETVEKDHSRVEIRRHALSNQTDGLEAKPDWARFQAVGRVESTQNIEEKTSTECRYFLCSLRDNLRRRKRRAALNDDYRQRLLFGQPSPATT